MTLIDNTSQNSGHLGIFVFSTIVPTINAALYRATTHYCQVSGDPEQSLCIITSSLSPGVRARELTLFLPIIRRIQKCDYLSATTE
jgi:hypothetical protein